MTRILQPCAARCAFAALALLAAPRAQDDKPSPKPSPATELLRLLARYESATDHVAAAKELRPEVEAFAHDNTGSDAGLSARLWLLQQCWWLRTQESSTLMEQTAATMVDEILAEYVDNVQFEKIADYHYVFAADKKAPLLEQLLARSKHPAVKASMLLRLGILEQRSKDAAVQARAKGRFATLLADYKDVKKQYTTYGVLADAHLHPLSPDDLAIGKPAPEITGVDIEAHAMKLSDFRGRVVVLDFWGFW